MFLTRLFLMTIFAMTVLFHTGTACAESPSAATLEPEEPYTYPGLFNREAYMLRFIRNHETPNMVTVRFISFGDVEGCAKMTGDEVEIKKTPPVLKLEIKDSELLLKNDEARYGNYDCEKQVNRSYFDVLLNRDELIENKIETIALTSEKYGQFMDSDVDATKERLKLTAHSQWGGTVFTYWFYPENTVILYTYQSKYGDDFKDRIREFGIAQGLVPLEDALEGFELPKNVKTAYYFTDPKGSVTELLQDSASPPVLGQITPTRTVHGPDGPVEEPYNIDIVARYPGQND